MAILFRFRVGGAIYSDCYSPVITTVGSGWRDELGRAQLKRASVEHPGEGKRALRAETTQDFWDELGRAQLKRAR